MKLSYYNYEEDNGDNYILYNCRTNELLFLNEDLKRIWLDNSMSQLDRIGEIHPNFFDYLIDKGFVVPNSMDEQADVLSKLHDEDKSEEYFSIIVNPTLCCNMRCWYCYEKHPVDSYITKEIIDRILKLANVKISNPQLKSFAISFFGGEPLLAFDDCVFPLLLELDKLCERANKSLLVSFTSNAFLLNKLMICKLGSLCLARPISWQITLDGGRTLHNKIRHTIHKQDTYDTIVSNIHHALAANMKVSVRLNYQNKSVLSFLDVIDSFREYANAYKDKLSFSFQQIWQDVAHCGNEDIYEETLRGVKEAFKTAGLRVVESAYVPVRCYADCTNSVVINYDGNIYKCTAQSFEEKVSEGSLDENGEIHYNSKYYERMNSRYANRTCLSCKIYPLCFGGCSQKLLYNHDRCYRNLGNEGIIEAIRRRIQYLAGFINI